MRTPEVRPVSPLVFRLFSKYAHLYVRRHMHAVRVVKGSRPGDLRGWPLIVCLNHPSWWDPLLALALAEATFEERRHFAPIDSSALSRYRIFERIGFFGIEPGTVRGAARFLRAGRSLLADESAALWITGEGAFTDVRVRPVTLRSGIGHLVHSLDRVAIVPLAIEYAFWEERSPEALACWGEPLLVQSGAQQSPEHWTGCIAASLERSLDRLADLSQRRERRAFDVILCGTSGVGGVYDRWRQLRARITGRPFTRQHGSESF